MIYQFDAFGRMVASHETFLDAAKWIDKHTYPLDDPLCGGLPQAAETIAFYCRFNDELQCLRYPCFGFWFSEYSFLGDL